MTYLYLTLAIIAEVIATSALKATGEFSKLLYEISDYPIPDSFPRVPNGAELQAYFENYAKDYDVYNKISFNTCVTKLEQQIYFLKEG